MKLIKNPLTWPGTISMPRRPQNNLPLPGIKLAGVYIFLEGM